MSNSAKWILEFTPSIEDTKDFVAYYLQNSPIQRKKHLVEGIIAGSAVLFGVFSCLYIVGDISPAKTREPTMDHLIGLGILALVLGLIVFLLYPENRKKQILKNVEKVCNEDSGYTPHKCALSLGENEIRATSETGEGMIRWEAIDKIVVNGDYIYLDRGGMNAIIIPRRAFADDEQRNECIEYIKRIHAAVDSEVEQ
jgi:hypothetical protein